MSIWDLIARTGQDFLKFATDRLQFRLPTDPVPGERHDILGRHVPLARKLTTADQDLLLRVARLLLEDVPFEGCAGLMLNDEIRVTIAATAAPLVYRLPYPRFTKLVRVLVYPDTFVPKKAEARYDRVVVESDPSLGQALMSGVVVLSWEDICRDAANHDLRGCVVLHEMAHILDAEDGLFDGTPVFDDMAQGAEWARILEREFVRQQEAVKAGDDPPLDDYAAGNHAEFFAVATEAFYCTPERLRAKLPSLYEQLQRFFRHPAVSSGEPAEPPVSG
jgi:Mlc titration factor MtfA (ptsG expression regulator)